MIEIPIVICHPPKIVQVIIGYPRSRVRRVKPEVGQSMIYVDMMEVELTMSSVLNA